MVCLPLCFIQHTKVGQMVDNLYSFNHINGYTSGPVVMNPQEFDSLELELTSKCTLACPSCARELHKDVQDQWDGGHLPLDLVKSIADTTNFKRYNLVGCYGDVIYHPDFIEICEYYLSRNKNLIIHTNGAFRTSAWWDRLSSLEWKNTEFFFSVDGLEDTNHIYRKNSKWSSVLLGMEKMTAIPKERRPNLIWKFIEFPYNQHQIEQARNLATQLDFDNFETVKSARTAEEYYLSAQKELYVFS